MKITSLLLFCACAGSAMSANILVDSFTDTNTNNNDFSYNDLGWHAKTFWQDGPADNSLQSQLTFGTGTDSFGIAQTISVGSLGLGSTDITLSFDWTPDPSALEAPSLDLSYQLVAWDTGGVAPDNSDIMIHGMNFAGTTVGGGIGTSLPSGTIVYDLLSGNHTDGANGGTLFQHPTSTQVFASAAILTGSTGSTSNFSQSFSLDLGANENLDDYDYIGIRFTIGDGSANGDAGNDGDAIISNISLDAAAVPEPTTAFLSILALGFIARRRR